MPSPWSIVEAIDAELLRIAAREPVMPRELFLHPFDYGEMLRAASECRRGRFEFRQEYSVPPFRVSPSRDLATRVENITIYFGAILRTNRYVPPGFVIALYPDRHPAVEVYRFDRARTAPVGPIYPSAPDGPRRSLWDRLRDRAT